MRTGLEIIQEFSSQDPASKEFMKLQDMIDIAIKEALNERTEDAKRLMNRQGLDHKTIMACIWIVDNLGIKDD